MQIRKNSMGLLVLLMLVLTACQGGLAGALQPVTIGMEATAVNALIYIAADQNYFAANGLDVTIKNYGSGLAAVNEMLNQEVDVTTASEFVIVGKAFANQRIRTLGNIDKFMHNYLIGRKDHGIEKVADLQGKKIGVPLKTAAEFYVGRFLELHGMRLQQVTLVDVSTDRLVDVLVKGDVDAVIAWQPNAQMIQDRLGNGIVKWLAQNEQVTFCALLSTENWTGGHPELVKRLLQSIALAENYNASHPGQARAIVQKRLGYDDAYMAAIWPEHQFALSLDQSLILAMEDEARWMIKNNLTTEKDVPNFLDYVHESGLDAIRPNAVNIIR